MKKRQFLDLALYIVLLIPALVFVHNYVVEYLEGKTIFVQTSIPISAEDVPAITLCFGYNEYNLTRSERKILNNGEYLKSLEMNIFLKNTIKQSVGHF